MDKETRTKIHNWNIEQGDYKRSHEATNTSLFKSRKEKIFKSVIKAVVYFIILGIVSFILKLIFLTPTR